LTRFCTPLLGWLAAVLLGGCAVPPYMPLADGNSDAYTTKPLYLMTVVLRNEQSPRYQPRVTDVVVHRNNGSAKPDEQKFRLDDKAAIPAAGKEGSETFLIRFTADAGSTVAGVNALAKAFPIVADYYLPLYVPIPDAAPGVHYLGSVRGVIRERKEGDAPAGHMFPAITQAIAGASSGTFDVEINDSYDSDVEMFKAAYPALKEVPVTKRLLPAWDRGKARSNL
jgi:hypothetical protein